MTTAEKAYADLEHDDTMLQKMGELQATLEALRPDERLVRIEAWLLSRVKEMPGTPRVTRIIKSLTATLDERTLLMCVASGTTLAAHAQEAQARLAADDATARSTSADLARRAANKARADGLWMVAHFSPTDGKGPVSTEVQHDALWNTLTDVGAEKQQGSDQIYEFYAADSSRLQIYGQYDTHADAVAAMRRAGQLKRPGGRKGTTEPRPDPTTRPPPARTFV